MNNKLAPCPFCGGDANSYGVSSGLQQEYYIHCKNCSSSSKWCATEAEAIKAWNTRAGWLTIDELKNNIIDDDAYYLVMSKSFNQPMVYRGWQLVEAERYGGVRVHMVSHWQPITPPEKDYGS